MHNGQTMKTEGHCAQKAPGLFPFPATYLLFSLHALDTTSSSTCQVAGGWWLVQVNLVPWIILASCLPSSGPAPLWSCHCLCCPSDSSLSLWIHVWLQHSPNHSLGLPFWHSQPLWEVIYPTVHWTPLIPSHYSPPQGGPSFKNRSQLRAFCSHREQSCHWASCSFPSFYFFLFALETSSYNYRNFSDRPIYLLMQC